MSNVTTDGKASMVDHASFAKKNNAVLNKFLTKTYHMIDHCDPSIASWSGGGDTFTIVDVDTFEKTVIPNYFKHSKFTSFSRQLNFYGFQKLRSDPDLQMHTMAVRFSHEYFRKGRPDLLHKIARVTAGTKHVEAPPEDKVESLQKQVSSLQEQMKAMEGQVDKRIGEAVRALDETFVRRVASLEARNEAALQNIVQQRAHQLHMSPFLPHQRLPIPGLEEFILSNRADHRNSFEKQFKDE